MDLCAVFDDIERQMVQEAAEANEACICKYCGNHKKPHDYRKDNVYRCHGCAAEWPTLFDNFFWAERHEGLYDELLKTYKRPR